MTCRFCNNVRKIVKNPARAVSNVARDIVLKQSFPPTLKTLIQAGRIKK